MKYFIALILVGLATRARAGGSGVDSFVLGASTGTSVAQVFTGSGSFFDIDISSGPGQAFYKCWDSSSTSGIDLSSEENMIADFVLPADVTYYGVHYAERSPEPRSIQNGLVCAKSVAAAIAIVLWHF